MDLAALLFDVGMHAHFASFSPFGMRQNVHRLKITTLISCIQLFFLGPSTMAKSNCAKDAVEYRLDEPEIPLGESVRVHTSTQIHIIAY